MFAHERLGARVVVTALAVATTLAAWPKVASSHRRAEPTRTVATPVQPKAETKLPVPPPTKASATATGLMVSRLGTEFVWIPVRSAPKASSTAPGWMVARFGTEFIWIPPAPPIRHLSKIEIVLAVARKQLGKPYRYGATGPNAFDCSGFTSFVWRAAGVYLPHNSSAQFNATKRVPVRDVRPGDLVFSPGHVGLYVGGGRMIHSPQTGRSVEYAPLRPSIYGAGRPAP